MPLFMDNGKNDNYIVIDIPSGATILGDFPFSISILIMPYGVGISTFASASPNKDGLIFIFLYAGSSIDNPVKAFGSEISGNYIDF